MEENLFSPWQEAGFLKRLLILRPTSKFSANQLYHIIPLPFNSSNSAFPRTALAGEEESGVSIAICWTASLERVLLTEAASLLKKKNFF